MLRLDVVAGRAMLQLIPRHKRKIVDLQVRSVFRVVDISAHPVLHIQQFSGVARDYSC